MSEDVKRRPNVIFIVIDSLRTARLEAAPTPNLDAFRSEAIYFPNMIAQATSTYMSFSSFLTGLNTRAFDRVKNIWDFHWDERFLSLPRHLSAHGYRTRLVPSLAPMWQGYWVPRFGFLRYYRPEFFSRWRFLGKRCRFDDLGRQFDEYLPVQPEDTATRAGRHRVAHLTNETALNWLSRAPSPHFTMIHYLDIHGRCPDPPDFHFHETDREDDTEPIHIHRRYNLDYWDSRLSYADRHLRAVLDVLRPEDLVFIFGDHGMNFGEHGEWHSHGHYLYDGELRVPLLVRYPGCHPKKVEEMVRGIDIVPTVLDSLKIPLGGAVEGVSLLPLMEGRVEHLDLLALSETRFAREREWVSLRSREWKYLWNRKTGESSLFHILSDPDETQERSRERPDVAKHLRKEMMGLLERPVVEAPSGAAAEKPKLPRFPFPFNKLSMRFPKALRTKFVADSFYLEAAHVVSNAVRLLAFIALASLLGAEDLGLYSLAFGVYGILHLIVQPPVLNTAVVFFSDARLRGKREEARRVLAFFLKSQLILSLLLLGVGSLLIGSLSSLLFGTTLPPHLVMILTLQNLAGIFYLFASLFFLGLRAMRAHAALGLTDAFVRSALVLGAVAAGFGVQGALWANVLAYLIGSGYGFLAYKAYARRKQPPYFSVWGIWRQGGYLKDCRKYLGINMTYHANKGVFSIYENLPVILVSHFAGLAATGQFTMALRLANIPRVLANPLITNTRSRLPEARVQGLKFLRQTYRKIERFSLLTLGGISVLLVPAGYVFFLWFSGGSYLAAFPIYLIILLASATGAYSMPQGPFFLTIGRMDIELRWTLVAIAPLLILSFGLGGHLGAMAAALGMLAFKAVAVVLKGIEVQRLFSKWAREENPRDPALPRV